MGRKTTTKTIDGLEVTVTEHPVMDQYDLLRRMRELGGEAPPPTMVRELMRYAIAVGPDDKGVRRKYELVNEAQFSDALDGRGATLIKIIAFVSDVNFAPFKPAAPVAVGSAAGSDAAVSSTST